LYILIFIFRRCLIGYFASEEPYIHESKQRRSHTIQCGSSASEDVCLGRQSNHMAISRLQSRVRWPWESSGRGWRPRGRGVGMARPRCVARSSAAVHMIVRQRLAPTWAWAWSIAPTVRRWDERRSPCDRPAKAGAHVGVVWAWASRPRCVARSSAVVHVIAGRGWRPRGCEGPCRDVL